MSICPINRLILKPVTQQAGGAGCPPRYISLGNFWWHTGKGEARKKGKMEKKRRKNGKGTNWKWKEEKLQNEERIFFMKSYQMRRGPFFFFFFFFFLLFTFQNHWFFFSLFFFLSTKMEIYTRKRHFMPGKKSGKMTLRPLKNIPVMPLIKTLPQERCRSTSWKKFNFKSVSCSWHRILHLQTLCMSILSLSGGVELNENAVAHRSALNKNTRHSSMNPA